MPGRPRKPTALHVLQGTGRKNRLANRVHEPQVVDGIGVAPEWFNETQREEWCRVGSLPWVKAHHRPTVIRHCMLWDRMNEEGRGGKPMTASESQQFGSIQMQMGFTAASESKVSVAPAEKANDPWEALG